MEKVLTESVLPRGHSADICIPLALGNHGLDLSLSLLLAGGGGGSASQARCSSAGVGAREALDDAAEEARRAMRVLLAVEESSGEGLWARALRALRVLRSAGRRSEGRSGSARGGDRLSESRLLRGTPGSVFGTLLFGVAGVERLDWEHCDGWRGEDGGD